jgi:hypothetical protein
MKIDGVTWKEVLATNNPVWEQDAEKLCEQRIAFVVVGFDLSFDEEIYKALKKNFAFNGRIDPSNRRAFFWPKATESKK